MPSGIPDAWDRIADVVVLGSGAAGLTAATLAHDGGAEVLLLEKAGLIGGTTGVSGGMPWIPLNRHMADVGVTDSREEALTYLRRLTLGREPDPDLLGTYVDTAAEMLDYLETNTPLRMSAPPMFSDYYADLPGGKPRGRSIEPLPFHAAELGEWAGRLRTSPVMPPLTMEEGGRFLAYGEPPDADLIAKRMTEDIRVLGAALVAALFKGLLDRGVPFVTETAARQLVVADGAVVGVRAERVGEPFWVGARKAVVLACGGFEWNRAMVRAFIGHDIEPLSPSYNEGDGHVMAMEAGAELALMWSYWGQPALLDPNVTYEGKPLYQFSIGRNLPGSIIVNRHGRRFANEGTAYQDLPRTFSVFDPVAIDYPNEAPVWLVFDHQLKESSVILSMMPGQPAPDWVQQAQTIRELAGAIGVDPATLEETVARFNENAARGEDPDFHRGTVWWEAFMTGGPTPAKCLRPVSVPPFYALPVYDGTLGTQGGPLVDGRARVRSYRGGVVPGLYAAGNASGCVFGPAYPGGGATLGPAMTFGYLAGKISATERRRLR
jgi:succinate dehydrogenase/fumarate reductase flavoprotein subunit